MADEGSPWRGMRWQWLTNVGGVGATGTGMVISQACRLYEVRGVAQTATGSLMLYDHTNLPQNPLLQLTPGIGQPDPGWRKVLHVGLQNGLYVSFSMGTGTLGLAAGWERQDAR